MAADLSIHVMTDAITERDLVGFFSNTLGSKWFNPRSIGQRGDDWYQKIAATPSVWIGEVSWLKAALFDDGDDFIPNTVAAVNETIGEDLPVLDDALIQKIMAAFDLENTTGYSLAKPAEVWRFLREHAGQRVFTVSW